MKIEADGQRIAELDNRAMEYLLLSDKQAKRIAELETENERLEKAIKVQASAVRTLQANEATEINILRQQKREWHQAVSSLDSERDANAILTAEIVKLREAGTKLRGYAEHDDNCSSVQRWQTSPCNCGYIDAWKQWDAALGEKK